MWTATETFGSLWSPPLSYVLPNRILLPVLHILQVFFFFSRPGHKVLPSSLFQPFFFLSGFLFPNLSLAHIVLPPQAFNSDVVHGAPSLSLAMALDPE